jgi:MFS transporter, DHA1 family, tetracycline resistance protein
MSSPASPNRALALISLTIFIDILGFGILIPIIPILLADPRSPFFLLPPGWTLAQGYLLLGFLTASFPIMQFLAAPILGQLSDRYGRRAVLALSLAGTSLSYFLFAVGIVERNLPLLFLSRALDGATGGVIAVCQAAVADLTPPDKRVGRFALLAAAFGLGFVGGPFLGGKLSDPAVVSWFTAATPFWFSGVLALANTLSVLAFLPETLSAPRTRSAVDWGRAGQNILRAFRHPELRNVFLTVFLYQTGFSFYAAFAGVFMIHRFGFTQGNIGDYFGFLGLVGLLTQLGLVRRVAKRWTPAQVLRLTLWAAGAFMLAAGLTTVSWAFVTIMPGFAMAMNLSQTNSTGLISSASGAGVQGEVLGLNASVLALSMAIPPVISGFLAAWLSPETPILAAAVLIFAAAAVFRWCCRLPTAGA